MVVFPNQLPRSTEYLSAPNRITLNEHQVDKKQAQRSEVTV